MYKFNKVGTNILLTNGSLNVLIPEADFSVIAGAGTNIIITILNSKVSPSLVPHTLDEDGTATIDIQSSDVNFPVAASTALLVAKLNLLLAFEFPPQGGAGGAKYEKLSGSDFDFGLV